jgi:alpha-L-fucosidase 2
VTYTREIFSRPIDQVIVVRLTADKPGNISVKAGLTGRKNKLPLDDTYAKITVLDGKPARSLSDEYFMTEGVEPDSLVLRERTATYLGIKGRAEYQAGLKAVAEGGKVLVEDDRLAVTGADAVTLLLPAATNFVNYKDVSADREARIQTVLDNLDDKPFSQIRKDHIAEHRRLFRRVALGLGTSEAANLPTDERLKKFSEGNDPQLAALFFQFSRFLLISS